VLQSAMPVMSRALVPEVLPAVMPDVPAVPEMLPAPPPALALPARLPADLPYAGRSALAGAVPGRRPEQGELARAAGHACWDEGECARLLRFLDAAGDPRRPRGREYPLSYLLALPLVAGMAGDGELDAAGEWIASAPEEVLLRLGAPRDGSGRARRPDATTIGRILARVDQCQYDDALCSWTAARARAQRPGLRKHLRVDGKALRGARRGGRAPMLLSGIWDDGTTAAQLPVNVAKTNEIPVFRQLMGKIPDEELAGAVITADQMHTQREHARLIKRKGAHFVFTIGENQPGLFAAADALCWKSVAVEDWTADRGHGRIDVRTIKTMPPPRASPPCSRTSGRSSSSNATATIWTGTCSAPSPSSASPACPRTRPAPATCWRTCAATGPSKCTTTNVRDVCLGEDASRVSRAHQAMAAIRNTVIGILHLHRIPNIAAQLPPRPLPAPAAAPRPHQAPGAANRKPRRDLNATIPRTQDGHSAAPTPASPR
jgi:DDE_Tnp_1-associated